MLGTLPAARQLVDAATLASAAMELAPELPQWAAIDAAEHVVATRRAAIVAGARDVEVEPAEVVRVARELVVLRRDRA
jgi:hypothetical protein